MMSRIIHLFLFVAFIIFTVHAGISRKKRSPHLGIKGEHGSGFGLNFGGGFGLNHGMNHDFGANHGMSYGSAHTGSGHGMDYESSSSGAHTGHGTGLIGGLLQMGGNIMGMNHNTGSRHGMHEYGDHGYGEHSQNRAGGGFARHDQSNIDSLSHTRSDTTGGHGTSFGVTFNDNQQSGRKEFMTGSTQSGTNLGIGLYDNFQSSQNQNNNHETLNHQTVSGVENENLRHTSNFNVGQTRNIENDLQTNLGSNTHGFGVTYSGADVQRNQDMTTNSRGVGISVNQHGAATNVNQRHTNDRNIDGGAENVGLGQKIVEKIKVKIDKIGNLAKGVLSGFGIGQHGHSSADVSVSGSHTTSGSRHDSLAADNMYSGSHLNSNGQKNIYVEGTYSDTTQQRGLVRNNQNRGSNSLAGSQSVNHYSDGQQKHIDDHMDSSFSGGVHTGLGVFNNFSGSSRYSTVGSNRQTTSGFNSGIESTIRNQFVGGSNLHQLDDQQKDTNKRLDLSSGSYLGINSNLDHQQRESNTNMNSASTTGISSNRNTYNDNSDTINRNFNSQQNYQGGLTQSSTGNVDYQQSDKNRNIELGADLNLSVDGNSQQRRLDSSNIFSENQQGERSIASVSSDYSANGQQRNSGSSSVISNLGSSGSINKNLENQQGEHNRNFVNNNAEQGFDSNSQHKEQNVGLGVSVGSSLGTGTNKFFNSQQKENNFGISGDSRSQHHNVGNSFTGSDNLQNNLNIGGVSQDSSYGNSLSRTNENVDYQRRTNEGSISSDYSGGSQQRNRGSSSVISNMEGFGSINKNLENQHHKQNRNFGSSNVDNSFASSSQQKEQNAGLGVLVGGSLGTNTNAYMDSQQRENNLGLEAGSSSFGFGNSHNNLNAGGVSQGSSHGNSLSQTNENVDYQRHTNAGSISSDYSGGSQQRNRGSGSVISTMESSGGINKNLENQHREQNQNFGSGNVDNSFASNNQQKEQNAGLGVIVEGNQGTNTDTYVDSQQKENNLGLDLNGNSRSQQRNTESSSLGFGNFQNNVNVGVASQGNIVFTSQMKNKSSSFSENHSSSSNSHKTESLSGSGAVSHSTVENSSSHSSSASSSQHAVESMLDIRSDFPVNQQRQSDKLLDLGVLRGDQHVDVGLNLNGQSEGVKSKLKFNTGIKV